MKTVTKAILEYNRGRDPERLQLKLAAMRADPFTFFRGTCPLFYETLQLDRPLLSSPMVLACGDLHLENFGSYKGDNRLVYFDVSDFDESAVAPVAFELVRFLTSILVAAKRLKISDATAATRVAGFIETYAANVISTKPRWVERSIATGPVRKLLQSLKGRKRADLIKQRTQRTAGKIRLVIDGKRTLAASSQDRARAESILAAYASTAAAPAFFAPLDIARRIAGNGSLAQGTAAVGRSHQFAGAGWQARRIGRGRSHHGGNYRVGTLEKRRPIWRGHCRGAFLFCHARGVAQPSRGLRARGEDTGPAAMAGLFRGLRCRRGPADDGA